MCLRWVSSEAGAPILDKPPAKCWSAGEQYVFFSVVDHTSGFTAHLSHLGTDPKCRMFPFWCHKVLTKIVFFMFFLFPVLDFVCFLHFSCSVSFLALFYVFTIPTIISLSISLITIISFPLLLMLLQLLRSLVFFFYVFCAVSTL